MAFDISNLTYRQGWLALHTCNNCTHPIAKSLKRENRLQWTTRTNGLMGTHVRVNHQYFLSHFTKESSELVTVVQYATFLIHPWILRSHLKVIFRINFHHSVKRISVKPQRCKRLQPCVWSLLDTQRKRL